MASLNDVHPALPLELRQNALRFVLASNTFAKNHRLADLLEYLGTRALQGDTSVKEYSIATDVFGRPPDFDQSTDAIVRVEMHRLRKKLKEYYSGEGADQSVEIVIQNGHYLPEFVFRLKASKLDSGLVWIEPPATQTRTRGSRQLYWSVAIAAIACALLAALVAVFIIQARRNGKDLPSRAIAALPSGKAVRILCGQSHGGYHDRQGNVWGADAFYSGGTAVQVPQQPIYRTRDPYLYTSMRSGEFSYKIPLAPGIYELRLHFADTSYIPGPSMEGGENVRQFNLFVNGKLVLQNFDIIADAEPSTADIKVYKDISPEKDGYLHLQWTKVTDTPLVNAIEITPGIPHRLRPIRIVTEDSTFRDHNGVLWSPDDYFLGGRSIARFGTVTGAADPQLYERERYGNFSYAIPVAEGRYSVTAYFAETYFGRNGPGGGGVGSRLFDVYCNGTALLRRLDMFAEAGSHRQIIKTFHNLAPNAQGKLLLSFVPVVNYANLSALEIQDETP